MELDFLTLDVFTGMAHQGNPLALVKVPAHLKSSLTQAQKQTIAREFNLSETAFLHEKEKGKNEWAVDIFTTEDELPFAGHPTIGAACYVLNLANSGASDGYLITKAGPIHISRSEGGAVSAGISHNIRIHRHRICDLRDPEVGLSSLHELAEAEKNAPLVSIVKGMTFLLVQLPSLKLLSQAESTNLKLSFFQLLDPGWEEGFVAKYYYVVDESSSWRGEGFTRIRTRMIEATMEDPATGSAACALGSYLALMGIGVTGKVGKYEITQGVEMGRTSVIGVEVEVEEGGKEVQSVLLRGGAVQVMEGKLRV